MFIKDMLAQKVESFSFEVFPPKEDLAYKSVADTVRELSLLAPDFISVTYGAGGGTSKNTVSIASEIQNVCNVTSIAHLTCVSSTKDDIRKIVDDIRLNDIHNILALRGDIPVGSGFPSPSHYKFAYELILDIKRYGDFCVGAACYPEGHVECADLNVDLLHLKNKVDCGCDFLISQLFFDNVFFYDFMDKLTAKNICIPVLAGIMPVTNAKQIKKICDLSGAKIPTPLNSILDRFSDNPADMENAGVEYASNQIADLRRCGFHRIHIYTMNKVKIARYFRDLFRNEVF